MPYFDRLIASTLEPVSRVHSAASLPYALSAVTSVGDIADLQEPSTVESTPRPLAERATRDAQSEPTEYHDETKAQRHRIARPGSTEQTRTSQHVGAAKEIAPARSDTKRRGESTRPSSGPPPVKSSISHAVHVVTRPVSVIRPTVTTSERPAAVQARVSPAAGTPSAAQRDTAAPEVHIHIGRIELTAVAPPSQPKRQSRSARPALALEDYLQRRDRRAR